MKRWFQQGELPAVKAQLREIATRCGVNCDAFKTLKVVIDRAS